MASNAENVSIWWRHHVIALSDGEATLEDMADISHEYIQIWKYHHVKRRTKLCAHIMGRNMKWNSCIGDTYAYAFNWFLWNGVMRSSRCGVLPAWGQVKCTRKQLIVFQWRHVATYIWVNFGLGSILLPDVTKPLSELRLTYHESVLSHSPKAIKNVVVHIICVMMSQCMT